MAFQELTIPITTVACYRGGWKNDIARFGTASGGHYSQSYAVFTPEKEDLKKLRNARINKVVAYIKFADLGGIYTKSIRFGLDKSQETFLEFTAAYNTWKSKTVWSGDSLKDSSGWGVRFLEKLKQNTSVTIYFQVPKKDVPSGSDYAKNYGGVTSSSYLVVSYEPLSSELGISENHSFEINKLNTISLTRYATEYRETAILEYQSEATGKNKTLELIKYEEDYSPNFSFTLPIDIAYDFPGSSSVQGTIILSTYLDKTTLIGEPRSYNIKIIIPSYIFPSKKDFKVTGEANLINSAYFVQSLSCATISCNFSAYTNGDFTDTSVITDCEIKNSQLGISAKMIMNNNTYTYTTGLLNTSGNFKFDIIVTNSRGHTNTFSTDIIFVQPYSKPEITDITIIRINKEGKEDEEGKFLKWSGTLNYSKVTYEAGKENVPVSLTLYYPTNQTQSYTINSNNLVNSKYSVNLIISNSNGLFDTDKKYDIGATFKDYFNQESSKKIETLSTTNYLIHFAKEGKAIGFGSAALNENAITMGWPLKLNHPLEVQYGGTGATNLVEFVKVIGNVMYPIGSIYMSTSSTNPSTIFGGTWEAWGAGRVPIGIGTGTDSNSITKTFDTANLKGGEYQHSHLYGLHYGGYYSEVSLEQDSRSGLFNYTSKTDYSIATSVAKEPLSETPINSNAANSRTYVNAQHYQITANTSYTENLPPYITCYMWRRIE